MYEIHVIGARQGGRHLLNMAARATKTYPVMWEIREDMFRVIRATFTGQGRRYGGSWTALKPETIERKMKKGLDPRIMIARRRLMNSLTRRGDPRMRSRVTSGEIRLNTTLPYAERHQYGDPEAGIPARPFIDFHYRDRHRWVEMVANHVMSAARG